MKRILIAVLLLLSCLSCSQKFYEKMYKKSYNLNDIVLTNEKIAESENPAQKTLYMDSLNDSLIDIKKATVKSVIESQNVDYEFCVIAEAESEKGKVQLNIFSKNINLIAQLKAGETEISAIGSFGRMYKLFDDYYLKIDLLEAYIAVIK